MNVDDGVDDDVDDEDDDEEEREEEEGGEGHKREKSNNPNLKVGNKVFFPHNTVYKKFRPWSSWSFGGLSWVFLGFPW